MARELGYLPQPGMSAGAGLGAGLGALGKTMSDLGQLSIDDAAAKKKAEFQDTQLNLMKNADTRGDAELKLKTDELKYKKEATQAVKLQEAIEKKDAAGAFRIAHPKATENLTDAQIMAWGKDIDKLLPKEAKIDKLDTRITPDGDKILTYMQDGKIVEKNMGKVKTDWNEKKASSEIPEGWVSTGFDFYQAHKKGGTFKQTRDGRFIAPLEFINQKLAEDHGANNDALLSKKYEDEH